MNSIIQNKEDIIKRYQERLNKLSYLKLDEIKKLVSNYQTQEEPKEIYKPYFNHCLEFVMNFYACINLTWFYELKKIVYSSNFGYFENLSTEDSGFWYTENGICLLIAKHNTIEDLFILVHEFAHYIADVYALYSSKLASEVFPLLMEYQFMLKYKERYPSFALYYKCREQDINYYTAQRILGEIGFILEHTKNGVLNDGLTTKELQEMEEYLNTAPIDVKFSYIVAEYYLEDYKKLEKIKELHKKM